MTSSSYPTSGRTSSLAFSKAAPLLASLALAAGCGGGSSSGGGSSPTAGGLGTSGQELITPDFTFMFVDPQAGGSASSMRIEEMYWGRMVDIYDLTEATSVSTLIHRNFVIGQDVLPGGDIEIVTDPITQVTRLTIRHRKPLPSDPLNLDTNSDGILDAPDLDGDLISDVVEWNNVFATLLTGLQPIPFKSDKIGTIGPFLPVARNGTVVVRFSDVLKHSTINTDTVKVLVGNPPEQPYEARVLPDPNYGQLFTDLDGDLVRDFRTTRVLIDFTISEIEANLVFPPPAVNAVGLPSSSTDSQANVSLRIPSQVVFGASQFAILTNLTNHGLAFSNNGPVDSTSVTRDVVRAFRSGSKSDVNNGFMRDMTAPQIVGQQTVTVGNLAATSTLPGSSPPERCDDCFTADIQFEQTTCSQTPEAGDILELTQEIFAQVVQSTGPPTPDGEVFGITLRDLSGGRLLEAEGTEGQYLSCYDPNDGDLPECFVSFLPAAGSFPTSDVKPTAQVRIRFSEPMDPDSMAGLEDFLITRAQTDFLPSEIVPGTTFGSPDLSFFDFSPALRFSHINGVAESYFTQLGVRAGGVTDLAGNEVEVLLPSVEFTIDPTFPTNTNGGVVFRFNDFDEDPPAFRLDGDGMIVEDDDGNPIPDPCAGPDITGQYLFDQERGIIRPRPVTRFAGIIDSGNDVQGLFLSPNPLLGVGLGGPYERRMPEPMSPLGARVMTVWRYCDMGFSINNSVPDGSSLTHDDAQFYNIDVEGLSWSVLGGSVQQEVYDEFEIALAHSTRFPDDGTLLGALASGPGGVNPDTGLDPTSFSVNALGGASALTVVHERTRGYTLEPVRAFNTPSGSRMMPYPLNNGNNVASYKYYTWRDTALQGLGGESAAGSDLLPIQGPAIGIPPRVLIENLMVYPTEDFSWQGWIPSVALPLLLDFRCFPGSGSGSNRPEILFGAFGFFGPTFRVSSSGGTDVTGQVFTVDPDLATVPQGGYNINPTIGSLGSVNPPGDYVFYTGQADFVTRVSRVYTRWMATGGSNVSYMNPVFSPSGQNQPSNTNVSVALRGASNVVIRTQNQCEDKFDGDGMLETPGVNGPAQSASTLDDYGDENNFFDVLYGNPANRNASVAFLNNDNSWFNDPAGIAGSIFFQARISMTSNAESGVVPELNAIGFLFDFAD